MSGGSLKLMSKFGAVKAHQGVPWSKAYDSSGQAYFDPGNMTYAYVLMQLWDKNAYWALRCALCSVLCSVVCSVLCSELCAVLCAVLCGVLCVVLCALRCALCPDLVLAADFRSSFVLQRF